MARLTSKMLILALGGAVHFGCNSPMDEFEDVLLTPGSYQVTLAFPAPDEDTPDSFHGEVEITFSASEPFGPGSFSATSSEQRIDGGVVKSPAVPGGTAKFAIGYTTEWTLQFAVYDATTGGAHPTELYEFKMEKVNYELQCRTSRGKEGTTTWEASGCEVVKL